MHVAIIGAGTAGLAVALTLHSRNIRCTIYESKDAPFRGLGALMLAPNALRILDNLSLYEALKKVGFTFSKVEFRDDNDTLNDVWHMGDAKKYSYDALRISRSAFLDVLRAKVAECGIEVNYGTKYAQVISETSENVTFQLSDGSVKVADVLIGADGVHSEVRQTVVAPGVNPIYSGHLALIATIDHTLSGLDTVSGRFLSASECTPQTTFFTSPTSSIMCLPQEPDGSCLNLGTVRAYPDQSREDWTHLNYDKQKLHDLFLSDSTVWPPRVDQALNQIRPTDIYPWPFLLLPDLKDWSSLPHRRVILVGDAAHTIGPTAGQGACQAIEDAYTLAMLLSTVSRLRPQSHVDPPQEDVSSAGPVLDTASAMSDTNACPFTSSPISPVQLSSRSQTLSVTNSEQIHPSPYAQSIATWQFARQARVARAKEFTRQLDNNRLAPERRQNLEKGTYWESGGHPDLGWLYGTGAARHARNGNGSVDRNMNRVELRRNSSGRIIVGRMGRAMTMG